MTGGQSQAAHGTVLKEQSNQTPQSPSPVPESSGKRVVYPPAAAEVRKYPFNCDSGHSLLVEPFRSRRDTPLVQKAHQGGFYYLNKFIHGILLVNDEFGGLGHFDGRVLITRLARQTNQNRSILQTVAKMAANPHEQHAVIGLVISRDFQKLPVTFRDKEKFGVSGFWHLSHVFAVRSEGPVAGEVRTIPWHAWCIVVQESPCGGLWLKLRHQQIVWNPGKTIEGMLEKEICST